MATGTLNPKAYITHNPAVSGRVWNGKDVSFIFIIWLNSNATQLDQSLRSPMNINRTI